MLEQAQTLANTLKQRRDRLANLVDFPVMLWAGGSSSRNFPANTYPFRASSHFLYFAGLPLENAAIRLEAGKLILFMDEASPASTLWHGATPSRAAIAEHIGADAAYPLDELATQGPGCATIAVQDGTTRAHQHHTLQRPVPPASAPAGQDRDLALAIATLRLCHDAAAIAELRTAAHISVQAHQAGMLVTIEPGFYQVPALLADPQRRDRYQTVVNWERLAEFQDVRGIRIEDDVLITPTGAEVLTAELPTAIADIEALVSSV